MRCIVWFYMYFNELYCYKYVFCIHNHFCKMVFIMLYFYMGRFVFMGCILHRDYALIRKILHGQIGGLYFV